MLDYKKYGFEISRQIEPDLFYMQCMQDKSKGQYYELQVSCDTHSLSYYNDGCKEMICFNRYEVTTQEQFDYLMMKGRFQNFFKHQLQKTTH